MKDEDRHTWFLSVVFTPKEGEAVETAAERAHLKKSSWARAVILRELDREKRRKS